MTLDDLSPAAEPGGPPIGLEHLSLRQEPLSSFVAAAAAGGAASVCLSVNHPDVLDRKTLRAALSQLDDGNLTVALADGFLLQPEAGLDNLRRQLDVLAEIGAPLANTCAFEPDADLRRGPAYVGDLLAEFCQAARSVGVGVLIEFTPLSHVPSLSAAVELVQQLEQPNLRILVDTLHLARAGEGPDDLRRIDRQLIGYCQLSDGPQKSASLAAYLDEAVHERAVPGDGELPLREVVSLLPLDTVISAEVPLRRLQQAGVSPEDRARRILQASGRLVARARA